MPKTVIIVFEYGYGRRRMQESCFATGAPAQRVANSETSKESEVRMGDLCADHVGLCSRRLFACLVDTRPTSSCVRSKILVFLS